ncbi:hypothetical protein KIPE111705_30720 [Kibdelosporangium persicum]|uniref:Uncharacterized protein n=1 Tax=Kibdelosporangium persicum TaxID=2698649 RepID=A0ABX2FFU9_9PSEU|nr:hypothetical protein [Kibdelosporangium persicum]NRN70162.1 hypothetical protein [Kibdelosporangium persicum]
MMNGHVPTEEPDLRKTPKATTPGEATAFRVLTVAATVGAALTTVPTADTASSAIYTVRVVILAVISAGLAPQLLEVVKKLPYCQFVVVLIALALAAVLSALIVLDE